MVYPWNKTGSLNNDITREGQSAQLQKKKISNIRWTDTIYKDYREGSASSSECYGTLASYTPQLFSSSEM